MAKFFVGVIVGIVVTILVSLVLLFAIGRLFSRKQPVIASNAVVVLGLSGDVPEASPMDVGIPFLQQQGNPTIRDIWSSLHQAANDKRVKALLLQPHGLTLGWAKLQELRHDLEDFKKSRKP